MMTIEQLVRRGQRALADAGLATPRLDAEVLLMWILGVDRTHLFLAYAEPVDDCVAGRFDSAVRRRAAGEPVAYIIGRREFMGLDFLVDQRVLVPRPETERLVEWAAERLTARSRPALVLDVGTGSGAIAVSLAHLLGGEHHTIIGCDVSPDALCVARDNAARLAGGTVHFVCGNLLEWCGGSIDLLLANLPYLRPEQAHDGIAFEPDVALFVAGDGFDLYRRLLQQAQPLLTPGGAIGCEIDPSQRDVALASARQSFPLASIRIEPDLAGYARYLFIELPS